MRLALISDIHANDKAFKSVIEDIQRIDVDEIVCLGDITTLGPNPVATLALLKALNCHCIMGNHDAYMIDPDLIHAYTSDPLILNAVEWGRNQLSDADLDFVRTFKHSLDISVTPSSSVRFFSCLSPKQHRRYIGHNPAGIAR